LSKSGVDIKAGSTCVGHCISIGNVCGVIFQRSECVWRWSKNLLRCVNYHKIIEQAVQTYLFPLFQYKQIGRSWLGWTDDLQKPDSVCTCVYLTVPHFLVTTQF